MFDKADLIEVSKTVRQQGWQVIKNGYLTLAGEKVNALLSGSLNEKDIYVAIGYAQAMRDAASLPDEEIQKGGQE